MTNDIHSTFQMVDCIVRSINISKPVMFPDDIDATLGYKTDIIYGTGVTDPNTWNAVLRIAFVLTDMEDVNAELDEDRNYSASIDVQSVFTAPKSQISGEDFVGLVKTTGLQSVLPIARGHLQNASVMAGFPSAIFIPNINVLAVEDWTVTNADEQNDE